MPDNKRTSDLVPTLLRGVRLKHDKVRERWVLLAPERVIPLDMIGHAILQRTDGVRSFGAIIDDLCETYNAPRDRIVDDCKRFFATLVERRMMELY